MGLSVQMTLVGGSSEQDMIRGCLLLSKSNLLRQVLD